MVNVSLGATCCKPALGCKAANVFVNAWNDHHVLVASLEVLCLVRSRFLVQPSQMHGSIRL